MRHTLLNPLLKPSKIGLLAIIPSLYFVIVLIIRTLRGPYWLGLNSDPDYIYLFNSLNILNFNSPMHTDHPGTPLQILGAVIIKLVFFIRHFMGYSDSFSLVEDTLHYPEIYLHSISIILVFFVTFSLFFVGYIAYSLSQNILLSIILQSPSLWLVTILEESNKVSPEPLLLAISQFITILLLLYLYKSNIEKKKIFAIVLGGLFGLGMSVKINFLPIILIFFVLPSLKQTVWATLASVSVFVIATLPIRSRYVRLFEWIFSIATHTSAYGSGEQGLLKFESLWEYLRTLFSKDTLYFSAFILIFLICFLSLLINSLSLKTIDTSSESKQQSILFSRFTRLSLIIALINLFQIIITLKNPNARYLIPAMGLLGMGIFTHIESFRLLKFKFWQDKHFIAHRFFPALWVMIFCVISLSSIKTYITSLSHFYESYYYGEVLKIDKIIQSEYSDCVQINYYRSSSVPYALHFGEGFSGFHFSPVINKIYPGRFFYNNWSRRYASFEYLNMTIDDVHLLTQNRCLILRGTPFTTAGYELYTPDVPLSEIFVGQYEAAYKILK